jgi:hypothetical protein
LEQDGFDESDKQSLVVIALQYLYYKLGEGEFNTV